MVFLPSRSSFHYDGVTKPGIFHQFFKIRLGSFYSGNLNSNKFAKAISHGNNQQLIVATYREQLTAEDRKRLIAKSINCWNLLHLLGSLAKCKKPADREVLLKNILATSTRSWEHINMLGEYDFSEKVDFQAYNLDEIFKDGAEI